MAGADWGGEVKIVNDELRAAEIEVRVENEIAEITQPELIELIRTLRVPARCEMREWDYGIDGQVWPCWIFAEHPPSNTAFAYCENGFGPRDPWGLLFISGEIMSMGMDSSWFSSIEDLFRDSMAWEGENPVDYEAR
jgi:hypothetical protein